MANLVQIGNSRGVRIPKAIIEQAKLEDTEISFEITKDGLLLKPIKNDSRKNWENLIKLEMGKNNNNAQEEENEFLDIDLSDEEWVW